MWVRRGRSRSLWKTGTKKQKKGTGKQTLEAKLEPNVETILFFETYAVIFSDTGL